MFLNVLDGANNQWRQKLPAMIHSFIYLTSLRKIICKTVQLHVLINTDLMIKLHLSSK